MKFQRIRLSGKIRDKSNAEKSFSQQISLIYSKYGWNEMHRGKPKDNTTIAIYEHLTRVKCDVDAKRMLHADMPSDFS